MIESKKLWLLLLNFLFVGSYAQDLHWLLGTWSGTTSKRGKIHLSRTIVIDSVHGQNFSGTRSNEADDQNQTMIVTALSGHINEGKFYMKDGDILYKKDPPHNVWVDCNYCPSQTKITIKNDSIFLRCVIVGCNKNCDGTSLYYKLLPDFDTTTQRELVNLFGDSSDIAAFKPYENAAPVIASNQKRQQQIDDSLKAAAIIAKKRQQQVDDSLKNAALIAQQQHQQHIEDSLKNAALVAKQRQKQVDDSLRNAAVIAGKRQQQIDDSLRNAAIVAKKRQQQIDDSLKAAAIIAKKRQQQVDDSLKNAALIAQKQHQQHIEDSSKNAALVAKQRQKQVDDSLRNAAVIATKRQQQIDDSLRNAAIVAKKRQQQIDDSLKNVAIGAKKRQQEIDDSLKNIAGTQGKDPTKPVIAASLALEQRENVLIQSFHITTPDILVELFDNAQIDGDMVSVFHNNKLIVDRKKLLRDPITLTVHADSANRTHEFIMVADNLGTIPPNTALMRITAGKQKYQLTVKTDLSNNAKIVLYYDGN